MTHTLDGAPRARGKDSRPVIEWIQYVLQSRPGAQVADFAVAAGVGRKTIAGLLGDSPRPTLYSGTYERIMNTRPEDIRIAPHRIVSGDGARKILSELTQDGWSLGEIARAGGLKRSTVSSGNLGRVQVETVGRILHAQEVLNRRHLRGERHPRALIPSYRVLRRVEALMSMGWTQEEIAQRAQVSVKVFRAAKKSVFHSTARRVFAAFEGMRLSPGGSDVTREYARRLGYAPWSAWPGDSIDREDAIPDWRFLDDVEWREAIRERYEKR